MAELEEEMEATLLQEPQPGPGYEEEENIDGDKERPGILSRLVQFILLLMLYCYVISSLLTKLFLPATYTPLVNRHDILENNTAPINTTRLIMTISKNGLLMFLFLVQHSLMAHINLSALLKALNIEVYKRAIYVLATCITLEIIHWLWTPISHHVWYCPDNSTLLLVSMATVHAFCWISIICSLFTTDYLELMGIKQIYYYFKGLEDPLSMKSEEHRELFHHMRHPIFLSPLIILWAVPTMTYDRILLAVMIPLYLLWGSGLENDDVVYVNDMYRQKKQTLLHSKRD